MKMRLLGNTPSPYVRKVRIVLNAVGLPVEFVDTNTDVGAATLAAVGPLHKYPVLLMEGSASMVLPDSSLIVNWLWERYAQILRPAGWNFDPQRWEDRTLQVEVEGALDAAINRFSLRRDGLEDKGYLLKQRDRVERTLDSLNGRVVFERPLGHAALSLGCALDWFVFRQITDLSTRPGLLAFRKAWLDAGIGRDCEPA